MKNLLLALIFVAAIYGGLGQGVLPEDAVITNANGTNDLADYALINDVKGLEIDKNNSKISFDFIDEDTSGSIGGLDFSINFNPEDPGNGSFKGTALVETLDTDNFLRDGHLMWKKFFHKSKHPKIHFASKQVVDFDNNMFKVIGNLTIKGIKKEVILTFILNDTQLQGKTTIYTSDFDVNIHDERERNKLNIQFDFPILK